MTATTEPTATRSLHPITDSNLLKWAAWRKQQDDEQTRSRQQKEAESKRVQQEEQDKYELQQLNNFLAGCSLPVEITGTTIHFGQYELRTGRAKYHGQFCLKVYAPLPYPLFPEEWDDADSIKPGEMAYAGLDIGSAHELAAWLLDPKTYFPPEYKPEAVVNVTLEADAASPMDRYRTGAFGDTLSNWENRDQWINEQADDGYRLHSIVVSPSMTDAPNMVLIVMEHERVQTAN